MSSCDTSGLPNKANLQKLARQAEHIATVGTGVNASGQTVQTVINPDTGSVDPALPALLHDMDERYETAESNRDKTFDAQFTYKYIKSFADAHAAGEKITDATRLNAYSTGSGEDLAWYGLIQSATIPPEGLSIPAAPDENWTIVTAVKLTKLRFDSASQLGLVYVSDYTNGMTIPADSKTKKYCWWNNDLGNFLVATSDLEFVSSDWKNEDLKIADNGAPASTRYGAIGNAVISMPKPLYYLINGTEAITNPSATDDTEAIKLAIKKEQTVDFDGSKGYLVSDVIKITDCNKRLIGNGAVIVYRGGRTRGLEQTVPIGIFSPFGSLDSNDSQATVTDPIKTFSDRVIVSTVSNQLKVGDWFLFKADNGVTDFSSEIRKYAYYPSQVVALDDAGGGKTSIQMSYKSGWDFDASQITLGKFDPVDNFYCSGFRLLDEMTATPTPDILPVPQAPDAERKEAVGLVYARNVTNYNIEDMQSYHGLYSCVTVYTTANGTTENIRAFKPRWFGGGEGYCVRAVTSAYLDTKSLSMLGGRHVIDWTTCAWCNHDGGNGSTDQVSFSMHTQCEHDINVKNVTGGDFYLANAAYGEVCTRITLDNCNFQLARIKCLHLTIKNSQINDLDATCGKATIKNTNITEFKNLIREGRTGWEDTLNYTSYGKLSIDESSNITRTKDYTPGTQIKEWYYVESENRWTSELGDSRPNILFNDCVSLDLKGNMRETIALLSGACVKINTDGLSGVFSDNSTARNFISIADMNINPNLTQTWRLTNMDLESGDKVRPFQVVGRDDSVQAYKAVVVVGGNTFTGCSVGTISDKAANNKLDLIRISVTRDAYSNGNETQVEAKNDASRYALNDVAYNKGSTGGPAVWDGTQWINLT